MSDGPRYQFRRGQRERIVDVIGGSRPLPVADGSQPPPLAPARMAEGSTPALQPPAFDDQDELAALAQPAPARQAVQFGGQPIVVERRGGSVTLVLPGAVRLVGSTDEARRLAAELGRGR